jgi:hypothetical protein
MLWFGDRALGELAQVEVTSAEAAPVFGQEATELERTEQEDDDRGDQGEGVASWLRAPRRPMDPMPEPRRSRVGHPSPRLPLPRPERSSRSRG